MRDRTWLIVGATAGVVIGIALFGLLLEAFAASRGDAAPRSLFAALACGLVDVTGPALMLAAFAGACSISAHQD